MTGTILNAAAIILGGTVGLGTKKELSAANQSLLKLGLGVFTVYVGLSLTWTALTGSFFQRLKQLGLVVLALMAGKMTGRMLKLQAASNRLGKFAKANLGRHQPGQPRSLNDAFLTCSVLYCVGPIALLGAVQDGLLADYRTLAVKALMDGLATMAFARILGWGVLLSVIPVFAYQGTVTLLAQMIEPYLQTQALVNSLVATSGLLIFCIALIILELKKIELADYLPSLLYAPLIFRLLN